MILRAWSAVWHTLTAEIKSRSKRGKEYNFSTKSHHQTSSHHHTQVLIAKKLIRSTLMRQRRRLRRIAPISVVFYLHQQHYSKCSLDDSRTWRRGQVKRGSLEEQREKKGFFSSKQRSFSLLLLNQYSSRDAHSADRRGLATETGKQKQHQLHFVW